MNKKKIASSVQYNKKTSYLLLLPSVSRKQQVNGFVVYVLLVAQVIIDNIANSRAAIWENYKIFYYGPNNKKFNCPRIQDNSNLCTQLLPEK